MSLNPPTCGRGLDLQQLLTPFGVRAVVCLIELRSACNGVATERRIKNRQARGHCPLRTLDSCAARPREGVTYGRTSRDGTGNCDMSRRRARLTMSGTAPQKRSGGLSGCLVCLPTSLVCSMYL